MSELLIVKLSEMNAIKLGLRNDKLYLKSEADKVIEELKAENERLRGESCKLTDGCLRLKQCRKEKALLADELRHSKYKRCLAMAQWCMDAECKTEKDADFLVRWEHRWLALAEEPTWAKFLQLIHKEEK